MDNPDPSYNVFLGAGLIRADALRQVAIVTFVTYPDESTHLATTSYNLELNTVSGWTYYATPGISGTFNPLSQIFTIDPGIVTAFAEIYQGEYWYTGFTNSLDSCETNSIKAALSNP